MGLILGFLKASHNFLFSNDTLIVLIKWQAAAWQPQLNGQS